MRILSIGGDGHDVSFTVLEDGKVLQHVEKERHTRIKMDKGRAAKFALECQSIDSCDVLVKGARIKEEEYLKRTKALQELTQRVGPAHRVWHHTAHAAHGFYSSNFDDALILTIDGGGSQEITDEDRLTMLPEYVEEYEFSNYTKHARNTSTTVWVGRGTKIHPLKFYTQDSSLGARWETVTSALGLSTGTPGGNQSGTVMAMAAFGDPNKFKFDWISETDEAIKQAIKRLPDKQASFDVAASLQSFTDRWMKNLIQGWLRTHPSKKICLSGGCALNSVFAGRMLEWFDGEIYVCPVPYDGGLSLGGAQYVYHHILDGPRVPWNENFTPYLGYKYSLEDVLTAFKKHGVKGP